MEYMISELIYRFKDRDIILVTMMDGSQQPMYRSTGRNSGLPGTWLPFDGITYNGTWFDKQQYCVPVVDQEFQRFGTQELKDLSLILRALRIPEGVEASWEDINFFLYYTPSTR